jgi:hypothetical protein
LIFSEVFQTKKEAIIREKELKTGKGRDFIKAMTKVKLKSFSNGLMSMKFNF